METVDKPLWYLSIGLLSCLESNSDLQNTQLIVHYQELDWDLWTQTGLSLEFEWKYDTFNDVLAN